MKLSNRHSNTYVGCLMSMFSQETYLNKEICASSAKDSKPSDTKVTVVILITIAHWFDYSWIMLICEEKR